jgi:hypothetical protein
MNARAFVTLVFLALAAGSAAGQQPAGVEGLRWFKGNTHTHTLNSDGDSTPEDVVRWYREQRYHFVVLTDHNFVTPVDGLNALYAAADRFLVIAGEEVTDQAGKKPVHLNLIGGNGTLVPPQGGSDPAEALQKNIDAMRPAGGLIQINHPNFGWALSADDLRASTGAHLIEIFNGHPQVNNIGGGGLPGAEALWDVMLTAGRKIYGVASDDTHELKRPWSRQAAVPGRGWVMVRAARLTEESVLAALANGDFYSTTGVELADVRASQKALGVTVKEQGSTRYVVQFIGSGGSLLKEVTSSPAQYDIAGGEGYVRARILDSNGLVAWTQPVRVDGGVRNPGPQR